MSKVEHMVWARFHEGVSEAEKESFLQAVRDFDGSVPGILDIKAGKNFTDHSDGYTHGWTITFECREALVAYGSHPSHLKLADPLLKAAELIKMDIEF